LRRTNVPNSAESEIGQMVIHRDKRLRVNDAWQERAEPLEQENEEAR
jgi:hypothetical protein